MSLKADVIIAVNNPIRQYSRRKILRAQRNKLPPQRIQNSGLARRDLLPRETRSGRDLPEVSNERDVVVYLIVFRSKHKERYPV